MKKILVFGTTVGGTQSISGEFNTWGELKNELLNKGWMTNGMKALIREKGISLELPTAELPNGLGIDNDGNVTHAFTLFLSITKTDSGK